MEIRALHHVSLPVTDLERARQFYREVLGLEEITRPAISVPGAWLRLGNGELHLVAGGAAVPGAAGSVDPRRPHFAVRVASYQAALKHLREKGYREDAGEGDPMRLVAWPRSVVGYPQLYVLDPDGHIIEINTESLDV